MVSRYLIKNGLKGEARALIRGGGGGEESIFI